MHCAYIKTQWVLNTSCSRHFDCLGHTSWTPLYVEQLLPFLLYRVIPTFQLQPLARGDEFIVRKICLFIYKTPQYYNKVATIFFNSSQDGQSEAEIFLARMLSGWACRIKRILHYAAVTHPKQVCELLWISPALEKQDRVLILVIADAAFPTRMCFLYCDYVFCIMIFVFICRNNCKLKVETDSFASHRLIAKIWRGGS